MNTCAREYGNNDKKNFAPNQSGLGFLDQMWKVRKDAHAKEADFFVHVHGLQWE